MKEERRNEVLVFDEARQLKKKYWPSFQAYKIEDGEGATTCYICQAQSVIW
jgi:hypothetical protein